MTSGSAPTETPGTGPLEGRGLTVRRWIVLCACAETIGMTASSLAAKIAQRVLGDDPHGAVFAAVLPGASSTRASERMYRSSPWID
ncbi:hypothetical protein M1M07_12770 [Rhodococcus sp. HM1]|uniref:hypothetical protein n=1 Tax=unclassified Rhodococcus (in: high G+C Gram-positive bacteria) TaxID=192944 RepID=UPI0018CE67D4|nr:MULTISPECIES: hypothetical protein [unclassified Rhodococcus (in: high G+C Gram-positive bacteria)]MBH0122560.1 hypothetical protein [Rhodococcus sp. CX]MCK8671988.1 hypothetical protein [Rhodococcus sp. HM1]